MYNSCPHYLSEKERYKIEALSQRGLDPSEIAKELRRDRRTIERELARGLTLQRNSDLTERWVYLAEVGQRVHNENAAGKGRNLKIGYDHKLATYIEARIKDDKWSPDVVIGRIKEQGISFETSICTKTVYNYIDRGFFAGISNKDLWMKRDGKKRDYKKIRSVALNNKSGKSIEERSEEANGRTEQGHWEIDLVVGKESLAGLDMMMLCGNVYQPEFDGQIISVTFSCSQVIMTPEGPRTLNKPIPDRSVKIAQLAAGWARLRRTPVRDKKAAIILHNMPPRADMIGCAYGLDTPASVYNMVTAMESDGFCTEFSFENGADIIGRITDGLTNDGRFLSSWEKLSRCEETVKDEYYAEWFSKLPEKVRGEMERDWGTAPGEFMTADGQILVPGIHNGNLFIGLPIGTGKKSAKTAGYCADDMGESRVSEFNPRYRTYAG